MPNLKKNPSALKAHRRDVRKAAYRGRVRTSTRTHIKKVRALIAAGRLDEANQAMQEAVRALDKAAEKGVLHKNNAARRKSRLMGALNQAQNAT